MLGQWVENESDLLAKVAVGLGAFEPFPIAVMSTESLDRLIAKQFVEVGPSCRPAVSPRGYRLTTRGWSRLDEERARNTPFITI